MDEFANTLRNVLTAIRDLTLFILIVLLFTIPDCVGTQLAKAGFTKIEAAGVSWENAQEATAATGDAQQQIEEMKKTVDTALATLNDAMATLNAPSSTTTPETKKEIASATAQLRSVNTTLGTTARKLEVSRRAQDVLLQETKAEAPDDGGAWGIVLGADKGPREAQFEVARAKRAGADDIAIYERDGWLRTVVRYTSRESADAALATMRSLRESAYIVNLTRWCPAGVKNASGVIECGGSR
jgi:hypothetical protein